LTWQKTLPSTESKLQAHLERKVVREIKRHQVAANADANKAAKDQDRAGREAAMAAHIGQHAMDSTLAAGATHEEAIAA